MHFSKCSWKYIFMLPYLVWKNLVVSIFAPIIIQDLSNLVEIASHFFSKSILLLLKQEYQLSTSLFFIDFVMLTKLRSRNLRYLFSELLYSSSNKEFCKYNKRIFPEPIFSSCSWIHFSFLYPLKIVFLTFSRILKENIEKK